ncbi:MAG: hypothetical protein K0S53_401 [Bacteroidetes bacterium]|jgi:hypothetical protein|nr:hypothetical protein [Bacteroidota bacterium]
MVNIPVLINGKSYSWQDITLNIMNVPIVGITKITYSQTQKSEMIYGAGRSPVSYGLGNLEATCSISLKMEEVESIMSVAPNGLLMDIPMFDIIVAYTDMALVPRIHTIRNCRFKNNTRDVSQDDTSIDCELELLCSHIEMGI